MAFDLASKDAAVASWEGNPLLHRAFADFDSYYSARVALFLARMHSQDERFRAIEDFESDGSKRALERIAIARNPLQANLQRAIADRFGDTACVWIYGPITAEDSQNGTCVDRHILKACEDNADAKRLVLRICSPGGELSAFWNVAWRIANFPGETVAIIDEYAFSAGGLLALLCDRVVMRENSVFMIHRTIGGVTGNAKDMIARAAELRVDDEAVEQAILTRRRAHDPNVIREAFDSGRYIGAEEAIRLGLADAIEPALFTSTNQIAPTKAGKP